MTDILENPHVVSDQKPFGVLPSFEQQVWQNMVCITTDLPDEIGIGTGGCEGDCWIVTSAHVLFGDEKKIDRDLIARMKPLWAITHPYTGQTMNVLDVEADNTFVDLAVIRVFGKPFAGIPVMEYAEDAEANDGIEVVIPYIKPQNIIPDVEAELTRQRKLSPDFRHGTISCYDEDQPTSSSLFMDVDACCGVSGARVASVKTRRILSMVNDKPDGGAIVRGPLPSEIRSTVETFKARMLARQALA